MINREYAKLNANLEKLGETHAAQSVIQRERLSIYIDYGRAHSKLRKQYPSTKLFGQELKKIIPMSRTIEDALRSDSGWLAGALDEPEHPDSDVLEVLSITDIHDLGYENPSAIRKEYRHRKRAAKAEAV